MAHENTDRSSYPASVWLRFLVPSAIGAGVLLIPVPYRGKVSIVLGHAVDVARAALGASLPSIVTGVIVFSALATVIASGLPERSGPVVTEPLRSILRPGWLTVALRLVGAAVAILVVTGVGPGWLIGDATGGVILRDLLPVIFLIFFAASFVLPCLTDFGLMELVGGLVSPIFRPLFGLPGRSAVDALASWLGAASVGVLITAGQFGRGFYTRREAAVIATNFSVVSIAFAYVIIDFVGLGDRFVSFYLTVVASGLVAAVVCPWLPPLRKKPDTYIDGRVRSLGRRVSSASLEGKGSRRSPLGDALRRAADGPTLGEVSRSSGLLVLDIWLGLLPMVAVIGTAAIVIAETTPVFRWLGAPFFPLLSVLGIPEAAAAAPTMVVGFADQFLPVVIGRGIESDLTRFVIACTCVNQVVYLSEVGVVILRSTLPLSFVDLIWVFLVRTVITLPIAAAGAHLLF